MSTNNQKILVYFLSVISLPLIMYMQYLMGFQYRFTVFFIVLVSVLSWYGGRKAAIILAVIGSGLWYFVNFKLIPPSEPVSELLWNALSILLVMLFSIIVVVRLKESLENEKVLSRSDPLTGLPNRRNFDEIATIQYKFCKRKMFSVSLAFIDIDNFKLVNDRMGHDEGDRLLVEIANTIKDCIRETDLLARMGGDEFILFLPEADEIEAKRLLTRIQGATGITADENKWPITFSIGVVTDHLAQKNVESLIRRADDLMYDIKRTGKDGIKAEVIQSS